MKFSNETTKTDIEELLERIEKLSDQEKREIAQKLIGKDSPLTVILGGCNINNSFVIQINNGIDKVSEQLEKLSPEAFQTLMGAIAVWIEKHRTPEN